MRKRTGRKEDVLSHLINKRPVSEKGLALIIVLIVLAMLAVLLVPFLHTARVDHMAAGYHLRDLQEYHALKSGVILAQRLLEKDQEDSDIDTLNEDWAGTSDEWMPEEVKVQILEALQASDFRIIIEDEHGKYLVNQLGETKTASKEKGSEQGGSKEEGFDRLLEEASLDHAQIASVIKDWIDDDANGLYEDAALNRTLYSTWELKGIASEFHQDLFGQEEDPITGEAITGLIDYLTAWGDGRVNLNTAQKPVLVSLDKALTPEIADRMIEARQSQDFKQRSEIQDIVGVTKELYARIENRLTTQSDTFLATIELERTFRENDAYVVRARAVFNRDEDEVRLVFWDAES